MDIDSDKPRASESSSRGRSDAIFSLCEEETVELGRGLGQRLSGGELLLLEGDLGLGKTVFARGVAIGLGVDPEDVSSPSFTLIQEYCGGRLPLFHVDLYRLDGADDLETIGLDEILTAGGVVMVEWGDRLPARYRKEATMVRLHDLGEGTRRIEITTTTRDGKPRRGDA